MKLNVKDEICLKEEISKGSFGRVHLTYYKNNSKKVYATKIISRKNEDSNFRKYFNNEMNILKELDHINIIHLVELRFDKNYYYIITDYYNGGTLTNCLKKYMQIYGSPFSEEIVQYLMRQIVEAIKYLHKKGIIHRDIKLDNILVNFENKEDKENLNMLKCQIKLIDFGFATYLNDSNLAYSVLGSPTNMDPIILNKYNLLLKYNINDKSIGYNEKVDIYSLGTVCYEMIIGQKIFNGKNREELVKKVEKGNYHLPTYLSKEIVSFLIGMLKYDEEKRLNADELSTHPFLKNNIKDFKYMNHRVNCQELNLNIKKDQSISEIFQEDYENTLINVPGNIFKEKLLLEQDEYLQKPDTNNIINNLANNNMPYAYQNNVYNNNNYYDYYPKTQKSKYNNVNLNEKNHLNNNLNTKYNPQQFPAINNIKIHKVAKNNNRLLNQMYLTYTQECINQKYPQYKNIKVPQPQPQKNNQKRKTYIPFVKKNIKSNAPYQKQIIQKRSRYSSPQIYIRNNLQNQNIQMYPHIHNIQELKPTTTNNNDNYDIENKLKIIPELALNDEKCDPVIKKILRKKKTEIFDRNGKKFAKNKFRNSQTLTDNDLNTYKTPRKERSSNPSPIYQRSNQLTKKQRYKPIDNKSPLLIHKNRKYNKYARTIENSEERKNIEPIMTQNDFEEYIYRDNFNFYLPRINLNNYWQNNLKENQGNEMNDKNKIVKKISLLKRHDTQLNFLLQI